MGTHNKSTQKLRMEIAHAAAKIMAVDGINDYLSAKKKAAMQLGIHQKKYMPANIEIEQALMDYQRLFQQDSQPRHLQTLRQTAVNAMRLLEPFEPLLVGPVLSGTATKHSAVMLHLFCDEPEQIRFFLDERGIPYADDESTVRNHPGELTPYPALRFLAEQIPVILVIMPRARKNTPTLSPVDGRPARRAKISEVEILLANS